MQVYVGSDHLLSHRIVLCFLLFHHPSPTYQRKPSNSLDMKFLGVFLGIAVYVFAAHAAPVDVAAVDTAAIVDAKDRVYTTGSYCM